MIKRNNCAICNSDKPFKCVYSFDSFPSFVGVKDSNELDVFEKMEWGSCSDCGCVQLKNLIDLNKLYKTSHNPAIGKTWKEHNNTFSKYILKRKIKNIIDIGGSNLNIAKLICESDQIDSYTIIDPVDSAEITNKKIIHIKDIIENIKEEKKYDGIILSHTLEHIYSPLNLLKHLHSFLTNDGFIFISIPNIEEQLKDNFLNALNFEHSFYINDDYIKMLVFLSGFEIVDIFKFSKYNYFYTIQKSKIKKPSIFSLDINHCKKIYLNHIDYLLKDVKKINSQIENKKTYCFGGHIFSQMLIAAGLNTNSIEGFLDNDHNKINKFLYGTNLMVYDPSVLKKKSNPIVILRVAQYREEIFQSLLKHNKSLIII